MNNPPAAVLMVGLCFAFALLGAYLVAAMILSRITLRADAIIEEGLFRSRSMMRSDIAGYRVIPTQYISTLVLVPRQSHGKRMKLAMLMQTDTPFNAWFAGITDLDAEELSQSQKELETDPHLGFQSHDRAHRVRNAKNVASAMTIVAFTSFFWALIYPHPYGLVVTVLAALPLVAVALVIRSSGIYQIEGRRHDARPSLAPAYLFPSIGLCMLALREFQLLRWGNLVLFAIALGLILPAVVRRADRQLQKRVSGLLPIFIFGVFYAAGLILQANSLFDTSTPQSFEVEVLGKHVAHGRSTSYYLRLAPWGPRTEAKQVSVSTRLYRSTKTGDDVCIRLHNGALHIPWFVINHCE